MRVFASQPGKERWQCLFCSVSHPSDVRAAAIDSSDAFGLNKIDLVNVVEPVTDGAARSSDASKLIQSAADGGVPSKKQQLTKKKKKKASSSPDEVGPGGATHHHANGEDFNTHAHRAFAGPNDDLFNTYKLMRRRGFRHLPVVENGVLVGMVSDRDLSGREMLLDYGPDLIKRQTVGQVMSREVRTCKASQSLAEAALIMTTYLVDALPVVSHRGAVLGVLTSADLLGNVSSMKRGEVLGADVVSRLQRLKPGPHTPAT